MKKDSKSAKQLPMKNLTNKGGALWRSRTVQSHKSALISHNKVSNKGDIIKDLRAYIAVAMTLALMINLSLTAFATGGGAAAGDPMAVINNLSNFIFGLIRAIGMILTGLGIVQVGLSLKSHDPSQRANGFLTLAGGIIITFAKEILNTITA